MMIQYRNLKSFFIEIYYNFTLDATDDIDGDMKANMIVW